MRQKLLLEEYNSKPIYIQGSKNITADLLSRLDMVDTPKMSSLAENFSWKKKVFHTQLKIKLL